MATNRSQIYIDTIDNTSSVLQGIGRQVQALQAQMAGINSAGFNRVNSQLSTQTNLLQSISNSISDIPNMITGVAVKWLSVYGAIMTVKRASEELFNFYKQGIQVNIDTEKAQISIAGLIASSYNLFKDGVKIPENEKIDKSLLIAEDAMKRLRIAAITTGASVDEIFDAFQQAVSPGASLGLAYNQVEQISTLVANTVKSMNLPKGQAGQEIRALLSGKIDRTATIGTNLGFGEGGSNQKAYKDALRKGGEDFVNFINNQMKYFNKAGDYYVKSLGGIFDSLSEGWKLFQGEASKPFADQLKGLKPIIDDLFNIDKVKGTADFSKSLDGIKATLMVIGQQWGNFVVGGIATAVGWVKELSKYLQENPAIIDSMVSIASDFWSMLESAFGTVGDILGVFAGVIESIATCVGLVAGLNSGIDDTDKGVDIVQVGVKTLSLLFHEVGGVVSWLANLINYVLGGAVNYVNDAIAGFVITLGKVQQSLGSTDVGKKLGFDSADGDRLINAVVDSKKQREAMGNRIANILGPNIFGSEQAEKAWLEKFNAQTYKIVTGIDVGAEKAKQEAINTINQRYQNAELMSGANGGKLDKKQQDALANYNAETIQMYNNLKNSQTTGFQGMLDNIKKAREDALKRASEGLSTTSMYRRNGKDDKGRGNPDTMNTILKGYEDELKAFMQMNEFERKGNDLLYSNFKKNVQDYYDLKTDLNEADYKKQQEIYQKELDFLNTQIGTKKNAKGNLDVENKITEITAKKLNSEKEYQLKKKETSFNLDKELIKQQQLLANFKAGIDDLLGNSGKSQKIKLQIEVDNLKNENQQNPEMLGLIDTYKNIKEFKLDQEQLNQMLSLSEEKLNILREQGSLTQIDYFKQLGELNSQRLAQYEDEMKMIKALAPDEQDNLRLKELENLILKTRADLDPLAKDIKKTFQDSFGTFFSDVISGTKSIKDAFKDLVSSISNYLSKLVSEKLAQQIFGGGSSGGGLLGGLGGSSSGGGFMDFLSTGLSSIFGGGKATGGFTEPGKFYKWNENGDEMFFSNAGGYVMNASRTNDLLKGGNSSGVTNINVSLSTPNATSFNNSEGQVGAMLNNALRKAQKNL